MERALLATDKDCAELTSGPAAIMVLMSNEYAQLDATAEALDVDRRGA